MSLVSKRRTRTRQESTFSLRSVAGSEIRYSGMRFTHRSKLFKMFAVLLILLIAFFSPCHGGEASTQQPSEAPAPTKEPSRQPSEAPTPAQDPTRRPTQRPPTVSPQPSTSPPPPPSANVPTRRPTRRPTPSPTLRPTPNPTSRPTPQPGEQPLFLQLELSPPTTMPSSSPSDVPSSSPTETQFNERSTLPIQQLLVSDVAMTIGGIILPLSEESEEFLEVLTSDNVARSIIQVLGKDNIENLEVDVSLIPLSLLKSRSDANETVVFDMLLGIQSVIWVHDANRYIKGAFNQLSERTAFLERLKETGYSEFANVTTLSVAPVRNVTVLTPKPGASEEKDDNGQIIAIAIVIPTVVAIAVAIVGFALYKRRKKQTQKRDEKFRTDRVKASHHDFDDSSKINMVVNTTMDTSNMSILEDPSYVARTDDMIVDTGDVSTLGGGGISRPSSDHGSTCRISEEDKVSVDFDLNDFRIRAGIPGLDDGNTTDESLYKPEEAPPESCKLSDDGSSAVAGMSLLSETQSLDYDYHVSTIKPLKSSTLPTSYDDYYANKGMIGESKATTPSGGSLSSLGEGGSTIPGLSLMGDTRLSFEYDRERTIRPPKNDERLEARTIVLRRSFDNESKESSGDMLVLDDTFALTRELEKAHELMEEDFSVTDSLPRIPESLPIGLGKMDSVNEEDISVSDSLSQSVEALPMGSLKKDMLLTDVSKVPDSLSRELDFRCPKEKDKAKTTHNNNANAMMHWETTSSIPTSEGSVRSALFEVTASKGILGIALEDSDEGAPIVKTVHYSSPLSSKVQSGDWLVKLDGIDVTSMPTSDVVRLITSKRNQKVRRFTFARTEEAMNIEEQSIYIA